MTLREFLRLTVAAVLLGATTLAAEGADSSTIRISGDDKMGGLLQAWEAAYAKTQPAIHFSDKLTGTASGIYGLEMRTADLALMGRAINPFERYGTYERSWTYPLQIEIATGNVTAPHKSDALAIFVSQNNALAQLSLKQVDGIFGAQRGGGWNALSWDESAARPASDNIRSWGKLGQADRPIHVYGPPILGAGTTSFFQARIMGGGAMWNEELREYGDRRQMLELLSRDPDGIAFAPISYAVPGVKPIALAETAAGPYKLPSAANVRDRSYPLARPVYVVLTIDNEHSEIAEPRIPPKLKDFLRFILSRQGQQIVERQGDYLPLPQSVIEKQLKLLDATGTPPERDLLGE